jgi:hypothetical protein
VRVDALFVDTPATPLDSVADLGEGKLDELAHRISLAGRQHIIFRLFLLQDQPNPPPEVARMTSVSLRVEIAELQCSLTPGSDCRNGASDFSDSKVSPRVVSRLSAARL